MLGTSSLEDIDNVTTDNREIIDVSKVFREKTYYNDEPNFSSSLHRNYYL